MRPKIIILLGPPASGKGTQAKLLAKRIGYNYLGTGDLLRQEIDEGSEAGQKFAKLMETGSLIPDQMTDPIVKAKLNEFNNSGIVIDGYPRNLHQVATLKLVFPDEDFLVINIVLSPESIVKRMQKRRICQKCGKIITLKSKEENQCSDCGGELIIRSDDNQKSLMKRIETYETLTKPLIEHYLKIGKLKNIDGEPPIPEVTKQIGDIL